VRKILVLFAHPGQRHSVANVHLARIAAALDGVTMIDLYADYPQHKIDVGREQQRLLDHDAVIFQFPVYWYSTPSLLKEWQDLVLQYGWAYGPGGDQLSGKWFLPAVTTGGAKTAYCSMGKNNFDLRTLLSPLEQTAMLCGMKFLPPYVLFEAQQAASEDRLTPHEVGYRRLIEAIRDDQLSLDSVQKEHLLYYENLPFGEPAK